MAKGFKKAAKQSKPVKMLLTGTSHSGKTLSALYLAQGMGEKIAVIDSEHGGSTFYQGRDGLDFDIWELDEFSDEAYLEAINEGAKHYDVLIIDSLTHEWEWLKDYVDKLQSKYRNQFQAWSVATPRQQKFIEAILAAPVHIICTARSKTEWVIEEDSGKKNIKKVGTTPQLRQGTEFEFDIILDLDMSHNAHVEKDRTGLLDGKIFVPSPEWGKTIVEWITDGATTPPPKDEPQVTNYYVEPSRVLSAIKAFVDKGMEEEEVKAMLCNVIGTEEFDVEKVSNTDFQKIKEHYKEVSKKG